MGKKIEKQLIGIDASRAVLSSRRGVENYSFEIIRQLIFLYQDNLFKLYTPYLPEEAWQINDNTQWKIIPAKRLWSQIQLAQEIRRNPPDVLFVPSHVIPILIKTKSVVTIHDLAYKYYPKSYSNFERRYLDFSTSASVSKASSIIVPSVSTKNDIITFHNIPSEKITVIPHGYDRNTFKLDRSSSSPLNNPYFFFVGRLEERKNLVTLIQAFADFAKNDLETSLILAGKRGFGAEKIDTELEKLPKSVSRRIITPGHLPQYDIGRYMRHAVAFLFPSLYEGFGIPVLEAMASGTPVICSDSSSLVEVADNSALILDSKDINAWSNSMSKLKNDSNLRGKLIELGLKRVSNFSWEKSAHETMRVIKNVLN